MTTTRTEYLRGYQDALDGKTADPPPEVEPGATIRVLRSTTWYERGTLAKLVARQDSSVWEADFAAQGNRRGSFMFKANGDAKWCIARSDFEVVE